MSPLGDRGDHSHLMVKHVDAQDDDTGHSILLLEEGGQGEKSQLELLVVKHLDTQILVARNSREKKDKFQLVIVHVQTSPQAKRHKPIKIKSSSWMREILSIASLTTFHCSPRPPLSRSFLLCFGNSL